MGIWLLSHRLAQTPKIALISSPRFRSRHRGQAEVVIWILAFLFFSPETFIKPLLCARDLCICDLILTRSFC